MLLTVNRDPLQSHGTNCRSVSDVFHHLSIKKFSFRSRDTGLPFPLPTVSLSFTGDVFDK